MILDAFDRMMESTARLIAQRSSGAACSPASARCWWVAPSCRCCPWTGAGGLKMAHANEFAKTAQTSDPTQCNYWRNCSSDGYLCSCCGGTYNECPPGSVASPTSWIGTCVNPDDNQAYLIAYQDCCGKDSCGQCVCLGTEGEMPSYRPELNNDIIWCFGAPTMVYHCSSQVVIGKA